jgi:hypothetical protein
MAVSAEMVTPVLLVDPPANAAANEVGVNGVPGDSRLPDLNACIAPLTIICHSQDDTDC